MDKNNKKETILIVDDIPQDVDILNELLVDYKRIIALTGEKALQIVDENPPDLVLLDIIMPGIDGHHVCSSIKNNPKTKDIPIIFLTALDRTEDKIKGFELGAVDYITKPFQPEEVVTRIKTHLQLSNYKKRLENINEELQERVKERTKELLIEKDKALESCRLKAHFLMLMSHELRTPMAGILGFTDILVNEIHDEELKEIAQLLYSSANRLKTTINSVLNLSKLESTKPVPYKTLLDTNTEIKALLFPYQLSVKEKNLDLIFEQEENKYFCELDISMFEIIINNLIGNAVKFTNEGYVKIETYYKDNMLCISVHDTGIGIPEDKHKIVFEEFRQVDEGVSRNFQGIGLGLSLVKKYVELMDGEIVLESQVNKGTTITIMFPKPPEYKIKQGINETNTLTNKTKYFDECSPKNSTTKYNVLMVEDDPTNIAVVKRFLKDYAFLDVTDNGKEAIMLALKNDYSAFIMDINLGTDKSGLEVTKEIREIDKYKETPIIAYTAYAMEGDRESFLNEGCSHYIAKPCSKQEFLDIFLCAVE